MLLVRRLSVSVTRAIIYLLLAVTILACEDVEPPGRDNPTPNAATLGIYPTIPANSSPPSLSPSPTRSLPTLTPTPSPTSTPTPTPTPISWVGPLIARPYPGLPLFDLGDRQSRSLLKDVWVEFVWGWSPDGCYLLYTSNHATCAINVSTRQTTLLLPLQEEGQVPPDNSLCQSAAGAQHQGYDHTSTVMSAPESMRWSPTGEWIAYTKEMGTSEEVFLIRPDGSDQVQLTEDYKPDDFIHSWSTDGQEVFVWIWDVYEHYRELYALDIDTLQRQTIVHYPEPLTSWEDLFIMDIGSGQQIPVEGLPEPEQANVVVVIPSPDFRYYAIWTAEDWFEGWLGSKLYILDTHTNKARLVSEVDFVLNYLDWSPDSATIALSAMYFDDRSAQTSHIYLIEASTGNLLHIVDTSVLGKRGEDKPSWSPDGRKLAFESFGGGDSSLMVYFLDSGEFVEGEPPGYGSLSQSRWSPKMEYGPADCR